MKKVIVILLILISTLLSWQVALSQSNKEVASYFANGTLHLISSSHQDIGWEDTPAACAAFRDTAMLTPALQAMKKNPNYRYTVESVLSLMEYLDRHPDRQDELHHFMKRGQLECGALYTQPYESMYSGEALIRQVYFGRKWLKDHFPGCDSRVYWNPDVPGRAMQMPQILARSGIKYLVMSRQEEGFYRWLSPDGSGVIAFSPGHYYNDSWVIFKKGEDGGLEFNDLDTIIEKYQQKLLKWAPYYQERQISPQMAVIISRDWLKPINMDNFISKWNRRAAREKGLPPMRYSTSEHFFNEVTQGNPEFKTLVGERPNMWVYIHGPTHHKALSAGRKATRLLTAAEKFATVDALLSHRFADYPSLRLSQAWQAAIYPDHGWGGHHGHVTDRVFWDKFKSAQQMAQVMLDESLQSITQKIKLQSNGIPVIVFNPLSWQRTDPVICDVNVEGRAYPHEKTDLNYQLIDANGQIIPFQTISGWESGEILDEALRIVFVAENVPSIGYKTYYLIQDNSEKKDDNHPTQSGRIENDYYRIELVAGGVKQIYDKELKQELFQTDKFKGAEVFSMRSEGTGAGEFSEVEQPTMEGFERLSQYAPNWICVESGPVRSVWETAHKMRHNTFREQLICYHPLKRIDFKVFILGWDGTPYREFRLAFPLNLEPYQIAYDVPMGVVEVGKSEMAGIGGHSYGGTTYRQLMKDIHPREVQDWFSASNGDFGVTISSSVAVFDWIDPTEHPVNYPILQPVLLASRRSCNVRGNWYLQAGDHHYQFSLFSHRGDWRQAFRFGMQARQPLLAVLAKPSSVTPELPEEFSFGTVTPENILISAIKKCEDNASVIFRCYEIEGKATPAEVSLFAPIVGVEQTNLIEAEGKIVPHEPQAIRTRIEPYSIATFKIIPQKDKKK